ncbi:PREDICTED: carboxylesterase 3 [Papilio xuthus]|uniref:Carboxylesterase 3 n=1 Tax=Papilio xuthus TaxID=66420 RepID=A0AAJ6YYL7_PAPXU|nr:PREDICTED: carboxylesterase 3 [Papilio xuthus]
MSGLRLWVVVGAVALMSTPATAVVGGDPASPPEPDSAVVFVQKHGRSARLEGYKNDARGYYTFLGIRYAEPPVGNRRFQRPIRRFLSGELTATKQCAPCPQLDPWNPRKAVGHEDCLCLNIYAPKMPGEEEGCPVVFFVHGGNYRSGSIAPYGGQHLAQKDTILVTVQYRLGSLGYLSTGQRDAPGNAGLFDLRAALTWTQEYIEFFGGDKNRIVMMGQGSGASAASILGLSPEGRSAAGVAALSGTPLSPGAVRSDPDAHAKELAERTGCPHKPAERLMQCLKKIPVEKIILADSDMNIDMVDTKTFLDEISGRSGSGARVEEEDDRRALPPLVSEQPSQSLQRRRQHCPLLTGVVSAETSKAVFGKFSTFLTGKLGEVQDFIKKELIGGLRDVVQGVDGLIPLKALGVDSLIPLPDYYQALFDSTSKAVDGLSQIVDATSDALFNFPAYQTVRAWGAGSPAFLYSFEHAGNLTKGNHFLPGIALTQEGDSKVKVPKKGPSHGDELAYIFEPLDESGNPLGLDVSNTDHRVRDSFVGLISKFAHNLGPSANQSKTFGFMPFSQDNDQFLKISDKITVDSNFRFCQMGLWGNMADRISGAFCTEFLGRLLNLPKLEVPVALPVPLNGGLNILGGPSRGQDRTPTQNPLLWKNPLPFRF